MSLPAHIPLLTVRVRSGQIAPPPYVKTGHVTRQARPKRWRTRGTSVWRQRQHASVMTLDATKLELESRTLLPQNLGRVERVFLKTQIASLKPPIPEGVSGHTPRGAMEPGDRLPRTSRLHLSLRAGVALLPRLAVNARVDAFTSRHDCDACGLDNGRNGRSWLKRPCLLLRLPSGAIDPHRASPTFSPELRQLGSQARARQTLPCKACR